MNASPTVLVAAIVGLVLGGAAGAVLVHDACFHDCIRLGDGAHLNVTIRTDDPQQAREACAQINETPGGRCEVG